MPRVKDNGTIVQGLAPNMQTFAQAIEEKFPNVVYTSGKREASQRVGKNYKHSHHNTGNALDISGRNPEVYAYLTKDPEGIALMKQYGLEAIDETNPETMKKTGATGPHYHIEINNNKQYGQGQSEETKYLFSHGTGQSTTTKVEPLNNYDPFKVVQVANSEGSYVVAEDMQKEAYKQAKEEDSDSRKALAEVREAKKQAVDKVFEQPEEQPQQQQQQQQDQAYPEFTPVDITRSMTPLESIFEMPEMKDGGSVKTEKGMRVYRDSNGNTTTKYTREDGKTFIRVKTADGKTYNKVTDLGEITEERLKKLPFKPPVDNTSPDMGSSQRGLDVLLKSDPNFYPDYDGPIENILEYVDPTGVLSWNDLETARRYNRDGAGDYLAVVPVLGKLKKAKYMEDMFKSITPLIQNKYDASKLIPGVGKYFGKRVNSDLGKTLFNNRGVGYEVIEANLRDGGKK
jgi:uncharacterized protein YgiB involved in biofilm formation